MSETTAEDRERWQRDISPYLGKQGHGQSQIISRLIADVERLEKERDDLKAFLTDATNIAEERKRLWKQAEAHRDEEVLQVRCIEGYLDRLSNEPAMKRTPKRVRDTIYGYRTAVANWRSAFLAGLSTVTPEKCERVSVCCKSSPPGDGSDHTCGNCNSQLAEFKCVTHHGPWPSDTERCPAAMAGNVTT